MITNAFSTHDDRYFITSYGNGWAYEVRCTETDYSFFVQDDAATDLQQATNDFEDTTLLAEYMEVLGTKDQEVDTKEVTDDERELADNVAKDMASEIEVNM